MRSTTTFTERARRSQLVDCAIETIAELGFAQASVRKIADRADVAMSVVLYHFGTKDDLVAAVISECYRSLLEAMTPAVDAVESAPDKLAAHIRTHLAYVRSHRSHQVAIMEIANGFRGRDGTRLTDVAIDPVHLEALSKVDLEVIIALGVERGEFAAVTVESTALAVRGALGIALLRSADPDFDPAVYADDLIALFLRALRADPPQ